MKDRSVAIVTGVLMGMLAVGCTKPAEQKQTEQKQTEQKPAEQKQMEQKQTEQKPATGTARPKKAPVGC